MKTVKLLLVALLVISILSACGSDKVINGKKYETIGLVNILVNDSSIIQPKNPNIQYEIIWGNVIWGAILFGTVIGPIYFFGFSMFEPVGQKLVEPKERN